MDITVLAILASCLYLNAANANDEYQVYLTTGDQSKLLSHEAPCQVSSSHNGYSVWVDRTKRRQTMDGFGAAMTNSAAYAIYNSPVRHQILRDLFGSGENELGTSYIRLPMGCSDFNALEVYTFDDVASGQTDFDLNQFSINKDRAFVIPVIKEALSINPNLKIMATPWSAPAWMKNNRNLNGGDFVDGWHYWHTYANYFVKFIEAYKAEGIHIDSLTVQNEPILSLDTYPTMVMTVNQQKVFIRDHLGPLFRQRNIQTKILVFDHNWSDSWFPEQVISDDKVKQYVAGVAWHGYSGRHDTPGAFHEKHPDMGMYFTEISGGGWDTNWPGILTWQLRDVLIGQTRNWAKVVMLWNIALDQNDGPRAPGLGGCGNCRGVVTVQSSNYKRNVEYYVLGHFSKFVKPGAVRLESNYIDYHELRTVAFVNPDGTTVIVVSNPSATKSASFSLDIDAKHYQYTDLPPMSVVTFVK